MCTVSNPPSKTCSTTNIVSSQFCRSLTTIHWILHRLYLERCYKLSSIYNFKNKKGSIVPKNLNIQRIETFFRRYQNERWSNSDGSLTGDVIFEFQKKSIKIYMLPFQDFWKSFQESLTRCRTNNPIRAWVGCHNRGYRS